MKMEKAEQYLLECYKKHELIGEEYRWLLDSVKLLHSRKGLLPISQDLKTAQERFNELLQGIKDEEKNVFLYLLSSILNGKEETDENMKGMN